MYSFMQAELSDIRVVLQKVSGSQIARGVSSEMVVRLFSLSNAILRKIIKYASVHLKNKMLE